MWDRRYLVSRVERYRATLFSKDDKPLHVELDLAPDNGGKLDFRSLADIRVAGQLNLVLKERMDLLDKRIQIDYLMTPAGGVEEEWPLARVIPSAPEENWGDGQLTVAVEVFDKTVLLNAVLTDTYTVAAGSWLLGHVISLIQSIGETNINIAYSNAIAITDITFKAGMKKRVVINEILSAMGYWSIRTDGRGQWTSTRYIAPGDRPIVHSYAEGPGSIYLPKFKLSRDFYSVPNQVQGTMAVEGDTPAPVYTAENHNPLSDFSIENRGQIIPKIIDSPISAASVAIFQDRVKSVLESSSQVATTISLNVLWTPLELNDVLEFKHKQSETIGKYAAANYTVSLTPKTLTQLEVKEVL